MYALCINLIILCNVLYNVSAKYEENWKSLDTRPLPEWYDEAKFGIFLHWGVYSVPSYRNEWFWKHWTDGEEKYKKFMQKNYRPNFTYQDFASDFTAEFFNPKKWAKLFAKAGAKYVVLTTKHHEGFTLWPSPYTFGWNAVDVGPKRDLVGDLADAIRNYTDIRFGVYNSLMEWYNPLYVRDKASKFKTNDFVANKLHPEMMELINKYKPDVLWSDGDWEAPDKYWMSTRFLAWLYNSSPVKDTIVVNDRWGRGISCHHGDFYTCGDRYNPLVLQKHKWENAMTVDRKSWGFRRNANIRDIESPRELLRELITTVSCGGNLCLNVGPSKEGTIKPIFQERLLQVGDWLSVNGEAIYNSRPWKFQNDTIGDTWFTSRPDKNYFYAIFFEWPSDNILKINVIKNLESTTVIHFLGSSTSDALDWNQTEAGIAVQLPAGNVVKNYCAWVLRFS